MFLYQPLFGALDAANMHRYFLANYHQFGGNQSQASHWYNTITNTDSAYLYAGFIPFLESQGKYQEIVALIPQLDNVFKKNEQIQLIFAQAQERVGNNKQAHERLIEIHNIFKNNQELPFG